MAHIYHHDQSASRTAGVRKYLSTLFLGLCVIAVGVGYLGNYLDFLPWDGFTLFFPGWGSLFLIIPSVYFLIRNPFSWFWPVCLLIGVLILISKLELFTFSTAVAIVLSVLVIFIGVRILLAPLFRRVRRRRMRKKINQLTGESGISFTDDHSAGMEWDGSYSVSFGERHVDMDGLNFTSATLSVSFGELVFNLNGAHIHDCAVIDANCSFGELRIILPPHVRAEVNRNGAFSEVANRHPNPDDPGAPVVYINASCSFGEIAVE